jgi:hypothetical protein
VIYDSTNDYEYSELKGKMELDDFNSRVLETFNILGADMDIKTETSKIISQARMTEEQLRL